MRARLYLDEDVLPDLARTLRSAGHNVVSALEVGAVGLADEDQLALASADGRAILSFNYRDFLRIGREWLAAGRTHPGIIISYRQYKRDELGALTRITTTLLGTITAEDLTNSVSVLDQFRSAS